ncbi:flagellar M-ring protein FliF [Sneathiella sp. P13V-1]|uniref:flagellar basal-body MS-ring/collar protein FliF n=1 Tax=Sneathiella sp. P13V-1 TaxID=2697366 RepID=UPI00187B570C|nr:flagellar basal-body MS-ring/collar protein FliF [Sneathiella sp. P13V-1]MBE7638580.1 flagellar M-ring protein FliF [Sneathiella sp. P13V-1]
MNGLSQLLQSLGAVRVAVLGGVAVGLIALIMFMATKIGDSDYALLFGNLEPEDSSAVVSKLEALNIPYQLSADGRNIKVPSSQVARARLDVAQDGLPNGGSVGYEIFDNTDTFGTTSFVQNVNLVRALEGELARTIRAIGNVASARVHLVLPKRQVFSREKRDASASIIVKLKGRLREDQIAAIQHLVAAAVPTLDVNRISIVDDKGNLLARGDGKDNPGSGFGSQTEFLRVTHENRLREQIELLLERSLGKGNVRVQVSALMDFDQKTVKSETYDPDGQVVRSTQTIEESSSASDQTAPAEGVTVANNLPEADAAAGAGNGSQSDANRVEETVNYEISKTVTTEVREVGNIRRLTVAVLVNGKSAVGNDGNATYQPLNDEELEQVSRLVRSSIGFNEERGDVVEVVNMPFVELAPVDIDGEAVDETIFMGLDKQDLFRMGEMAVLAVVAVLALLLVVRPLLTRALATDSAGNALAIPGAAPGIPGGIPGPDGTVALPETAGVGGISGPVDSEGNPIQSETLTELDEMIDIAKVDGQVKTSALKKVGEIVEKHPDEAVAILRNWLYHEA